MGDFLLGVNLLYGFLVAGFFLFDLKSLYRLPNTTVLGFCFYLLFSFVIKKLYKAYGPEEDSSPVYSYGWFFDDFEDEDEFDSYFRAVRVSCEDEYEDHRDELLAAENNFSYEKTDFSDTYLDPNRAFAAFSTHSGYSDIFESFIFQDHENE